MSEEGTPVSFYIVVEYTLQDGVQVRGIFSTFEKASMVAATNTNWRVRAIATTQEAL